MSDMISREAAIAKFTAMLPETEKHRKIDIHAVIDYLSALPAVGVKPLVWSAGDECIVAHCNLMGRWFNIAFEEGKYWPITLPDLPSFQDQEDAIRAVDAWRAARFMAELTWQEGA